jgi:hypothetical protein
MLYQFQVNYLMLGRTTLKSLARFRTSAEREGLGTPKEASARGRQTSAISSISVWSTKRTELLRIEHPSNFENRQVSFHEGLPVSKST